MRRVIILLTLSALALMSASGAWGAVTGAASGRATEAETGAPLAGVNVVLVGTELTTVTDRSGGFTITNIPPGSYTVSFSLVGYRETRVTGVSVTQDHTVPVEATLEKAVIEVKGAEAKVTAARIAPRTDQTASVYTVTARDEEVTLSQPNDRYQFPGLVFSQPGAVPDSTFYPHIRGGRANQVGYFLDGIPITEPNTNVFATNIVSIGLDRLEYFSGGYPASYGGYVGGIVNEVVKRGDQVEGGGFDVSAGIPYGMSQFILDRGESDGRLNWYLGANTWGSRFNENLFTSEAPTSNDLMAKVIYRLDRRNSLTLLSSHGYARYLFPFEHTRTFDPGSGQWIDTSLGTDFARQGHEVDALTLNHTLSPEAYWTLRFFRVGHFLHLDLGSDLNGVWQQREENMRGAQLDYQQQLGRHQVSSGMWQIESENRLHATLDYADPDLGLLDYQSNNDTSNLQWYLQDLWKASDRLTCNLGMRYDRMKYQRPLYGALKLEEWSPRAGLTYAVSSRLLLRGSTGRYVQFPPASRSGTAFATGDPNDPLNPPSWYLMQQGASPVLPQLDRSHEAGMEAKIGSSTLATATYFWRRSRQVLQLWGGASDSLGDFDPDSPFYFASNGRASAHGMELKVDRRMSKSLRAWLSYTRLKARGTSAAENLYPFGYSFALRRDAEGLSQEFPLEWDQRDTVALALSYRKGRLTVNPWLVYGSGFPFGQSGIDLGSQDPQYGPRPDDPEVFDVPILHNGQLQPTDPNALRTGNNFTVSLNLSYQVEKDRGIYLDIFNIFNRRDVTSLVWYHPNTFAPIGYQDPTPDSANSGDEFYAYQPWTKTPPRFIAVGIKQGF
jgi:outer membrane receptor protein involved in Fe transport